MNSELNEIANILTVFAKVIGCFLIVCLMFSLLYKLYKRVTGKSINWIENGVDINGSSYTERTVDDHLEYLGVDTDESTNIKTSVGVAGSTPVSMASPVTKLETYVYFKYRDEIIKIKSNSNIELYFMVKNKEFKYKTVLNCKVKERSEFDRVILRTIKSIEGISVNYVCNM